MSRKTLLAYNQGRLDAYLSILNPDKVKTKAPHTYFGECSLIDNIEIVVKYIEEIQSMDTLDEI